MAEYDHYVRTEKIRPIGGTKIEWAAKACLNEIGGNGKEIVLHEHLGKTEAEAAAKAVQEAREWIAKKQSNA